MNVIPTVLPGVLIVEPKFFGDERGFSLDGCNQRAFDDVLGQEVDFVQDNHSRSSRGVLPGLHCQLPPHMLGKLVRVTQALVFDVAVDLRTSSPRFAHWVGVEMSGESPPNMAAAGRWPIALWSSAAAPTFSASPRVTTRPRPSAAYAGTTGHRHQLATSRARAAPIRQGRGGAACR